MKGPNHLGTLEDCASSHLLKTAYPTVAIFSFEVFDILATLLSNLMIANVHDCRCYKVNQFEKNSILLINTYHYHGYFNLPPSASLTTYNKISAMHG